MKEKLSVADFVKHLDTYEDHRVDFGRKHSGIMASMKDLEMLIKYLNDNKIIHIDGCVLLDFCSYIRQVRKNCAATMNRKISSIKLPREPYRIILKNSFKKRAFSALKNLHRTV